jgi:hypothetical protein
MTAGWYRRRTCQRRCGLVWRWMSEVMEWEKLLLRVSILQSGVGKRAGPCWRGCLLSLSSLGERARAEGRHHDTIPRSARDSRTIRCLRCLCSCYVFILTSPQPTLHRFAIENVRSLVVTTVLTPTLAYNHSASPASDDSKSHDPTRTGHQRR